MGGGGEVYTSRQADTPPGRHPPGQKPFPPMATAADGTLPTGMHSSWRLCDQTLVILVNFLGNRTLEHWGGAGDQSSSECPEIDFGFEIFEIR